MTMAMGGCTPSHFTRRAPRPCRRGRIPSGRDDDNASAHRTAAAGHEERQGAEAGNKVRETPCARDGTAQCNRHPSMSPVAANRSPRTRGTHTTHRSWGTLGDNVGAGVSHGGDAGERNGVGSAATKKRERCETGSIGDRGRPRARDPRRRRNTVRRRRRHGPGGGHRRRGHRSVSLRRRLRARPRPGEGRRHRVHPTAMDVDDDYEDIVVLAQSGGDEAGEL